MEPITQFVFKYAPELNTYSKSRNPKEVPSLQDIIYDYFDRESIDLKDLPVGMQVNFLTRCGCVQKWYKARHLCTLEALNIVSRVVLKNHGFYWIKQENTFERLLQHLFEQAIRNPEAKQKEIDQLIECKRQNQSQVIALKDRTLSIFERSVLSLSYVWNYRLNINHNRAFLNIQVNVPIVPRLVNIASYYFLYLYVLPSCINRYQPRGINFLVNHLSPQTFPIVFKVYDCAWWLSWLPLIPQRVGNTYPIVYRSILTVQKGAKLMADIYRIPVKIAELGAHMVFKSMDLAVPMLEKVENYSELVRYSRELREVKALWLSEFVKTNTDQA